MQLSCEGEEDTPWPDPTLPPPKPTNLPGGTGSLHSVAVVAGVDLLGLVREVLLASSSKPGSREKLVRGMAATGDVSERRTSDDTYGTSEGPPRSSETHDPRHWSDSTGLPGQPAHATSGSCVCAWAPPAGTWRGLSTPNLPARTFLARATSWGDQL